MEITEAKAKEALDFIAKKLGGCKCVLICNGSEAKADGTPNFVEVRFVGVRNENGPPLYMMTSLPQQHGFSALTFHGSWFEVAREVVGKDCFVADVVHRSFTIPESLEELLIMMDLEEE